MQSEYQEDRDPEQIRGTSQRAESYMEDKKTAKITPLIAETLGALRKTF